MPRTCSRDVEGTVRWAARGVPHSCAAGAMTALASSTPRDHFGQKDDALGLWRADDDPCLFLVMSRNSMPSKSSSACQAV